MLQGRIRSSTTIALRHAKFQNEEKRLRGGVINRTLDETIACRSRFTEQAQVSVTKVTGNSFSLFPFVLFFYLPRFQLSDASDGREFNGVSNDCLSPELIRTQQAKSGILVQTTVLYKKNRLNQTKTRSQARSFDATSSIGVTANVYRKGNNKKKGQKGPLSYTLSLLCRLRNRELSCSLQEAKDKTMERKGKGRSTGRMRCISRRLRNGSHFTAAVFGRKPTHTHDRPTCTCTNLPSGWKRQERKKQGIEDSDCYQHTQQLTSSCCIIVGMQNISCSKN